MRGMFSCETSVSREDFELLQNRDPEKAKAALSRKRKTITDLALMLSQGADGLIEEMAQKAHEATLRHFGKTIQLYIPVYLSNHCVGGCPYCGFKRSESIGRATLTVEEVVSECRAVRKMGMRHILLVSGEVPTDVDVEYLQAIITRLKEFMPSVSIEVAPLSVEDYARLRQAGLDGVTLYQETYDRSRYALYHSKGPKRDFDFRLATLDRAGEAGLSNLTAGALLGLRPWREEALVLGAHLRHLEKAWWTSQVSVGMPRLKKAPSDFDIPFPVDDKALTQIILALRNFGEKMGIALSTREQPDFRDSLIPLGVTQISAGSSTRPGGYAKNDRLGDQFEVTDCRSPAEISDMLRKKGYEPVFKDWDREFGDGGER